MSRQALPVVGWGEPYSSPMFMPPVKAIRRSATKILRWSRKGWSHQKREKSGLKSFTSTPLSFISRQNPARVVLEPAASAITRTAAPRRAAAAASSRKVRPVASSLKM